MYKHPEKFEVQKYFSVDILNTCLKFNTFKVMSNYKKELVNNIEMRNLFMKYSYPQMWN